MTLLDRQLELGAAMVAAGLALLAGGGVAVALIVAGVVLVVGAIADVRSAIRAGAVRVR